MHISILFDESSENISLYKKKKTFHRIFFTSQYTKNCEKLNYTLE